MDQIAVALNELSVAFAHLSEALKQDVKAANTAKAEKTKAKTTKVEPEVLPDEKPTAEIEEARKRAEDISAPIKLEVVRAYLAELSQNGHTTEVKDLLKKYGANKLSAIKQEDYIALMKDAEAIANNAA